MPKTSLTDRAYAQIKKWILGYSLKPGSHLSIEELAAAMGISRTPVREALSRLEQKQLVERIPMKGFAVKALNLKEIEDLFQVRTALESLAARQASTRASQASLVQLGESLTATAETIETGSRNRSLDLEQNFHVQILKASGNVALAEIGLGVLERIWGIQRFGLVNEEDLCRAHTDHTTIFEAMKARDSHKAAAFMLAHLEYTTKFMMDRLSDRTDALQNVLADRPETIDLQADDDLEESRQARG